MIDIKSAFRPLTQLPGYRTGEAPFPVRRLQQSITIAAFAISTLILVVMSVLTGVEVFMRYFFDQPLGWNVNFTEQYLMVGLTFFGVTVAYRTAAHVAVASVYDRLPASTRKLVLLLSQAVIIAAVLPVMLNGAVAAGLSFGLNETPAVGGSELPFNYGLWKSLVPIGSALLIITVLIDFVRELCADWSGPITEVTRPTMQTEVRAQTTTETDGGSRP
ncbi:TRAP transporter small permease [Brevibacterium sp. UCMA 11754]|uniref:TRAP transporter small permease n=1 Tax=Brevibacterium sp. UCMA 11754 TaxID=2749198 RepID=UPI001F3F8F7E|nr:TRAP transporter small permease [Brevibacterium sp. UCMA 11754]MCF2570771.1 TRAP transporter small permease [Brevibacterium sp. UCMA 11754]